MEDCDANILGYNDVQDGTGADMELNSLVDPLLDVIKTEVLDEENEDLIFATVKYLKEPKREFKVKKKIRKQGIGISLKNFKIKNRIQRLELKIMEAEGVQNGSGWSCNRCSDVCKDGPTFLDHLHKAHHILSPTIKKNQDVQKQDKRLQPYYVKREKNSWQCRMCSIQYNLKSTFVNHLRKFHNIEISVLEYKCPHCDREFASDQSLRNHVKRLHAGKVAMAKDPISCDTLVDTERDLMIENGHQDGEGMWRCNKCGLRYNENTFVAHLKKFHRVGQSALSSHVCKYCNQRLAHTGSLNAHIRSMHPDKQSTGSEIREEDRRKMNKCPHCDMEFRSERSLGGHIKLLHTGKDSVSLEAEKTAKEKNAKMIKYGPKVDLKEYGKQDKETKSWCCTICGTRFSIVSRLINHLKRTHNIKIGSYDYKCSFCQMEFRNDQARRNHIVRIHYARKKISGNKNKVTKNSVQESRELKKHGKRNQYGTWLCNHCSAMYDKKAAFIRHLESSHNVDVVDVKFDCPSCDKNYLTYMSLCIHLKNKHRSNDDEISGEMNKDINTPVEGSETIVSVQHAVVTCTKTVEV